MRWCTGGIGGMLVTVTYWQDGVLVASVGCGGLLVLISGGMMGNVLIGGSSRMYARVSIAMGDVLVAYGGI